jgi:Protein of unknown function (DUF3987)
MDGFEFEKVAAEADAAAAPKTSFEIEPAWPQPIDAEAFYGVAGDAVRLIEPHTEADPVALLSQFLVGFGNLLDRNAHYRVEDTKHHTNEFCVLVGRSSKARKGTAEKRVRSLLSPIDEKWERECIVSGLSSGEGLIWQVRDPIFKREKVRQRGQPARYEEVEVDRGVADKRLLAIESEFASVLRLASREGNILSPIIRKAWDGDDVLRALTKNSPAKATKAHISIIGHVTIEELRVELDRTECANGFANRFMFLCVKRSRELPFGGASEIDFSTIQRRLHYAVEHAPKIEKMTFEPDAREVWKSVYHDLSAERSGLFGAVVARAEPHVLRLAVIYALLGCSLAIKRDHLFAALALWKYAEASARYVFGDAIGIPVADEILAALRRAPQGLTRTEISNLFSRHQKGNRIGNALGLLLRHGLARFVKEAGEGRPPERWFAATEEERKKRTNGSRS